MFSNDVEIRNGNSHALFDEQGKRINFASDIKIGNHNWLGAHVRILKGVSTEYGITVGNSSILTNNASKANSIYVGGPARLIKENVFWNRAR